jgi:Tol biopolymer transport system component
MSINSKGTQMLNRTILAGLLSILALAAFAVPGAMAAGHGGAVVFSRAIVKTEKETVKDAEGNPVKDSEGNVETKQVTTEEGGLYAVKDGRLNQLTEDPTDTEPSFAPDGRQIVFSRGGDVFTVRADGSGLRRLTSGPTLDSAPQVSPNGRVVLFERRATAGTPADLYTVGANGGAAKALVTTPDDEHEASFSPDGKSIVFVRSVAETDGGTADDIYSVRPNGSGLARLTRTARVDEFDPRYFAGGIVFSRGESGEDPSAYADVYTMKANGRKVKALVAGAGSAYVEDVTPDGHTVLFRRDRGLWVKKIGAGAARKLSELPDGSKTDAVFSSDGKQIAAFIEAEGEEQLSSISVASGGSDELAEGFEPGKAGEGDSTDTIGPVITWQPTR